jgi:hypothetical protein
MKQLCVAVAALPLLLEVAGCGKSGGTPPTDEWLGTWTGVEGTSLELLGGQGSYEIIIRDLDGPRTFRGTGADDHIRFERNGVAETIRATNGEATGMKWLAEKSNCLTIRYGEGFCRD